MKRLHDAPHHPPYALLVQRPRHLLGVVHPVERIIRQPLRVPMLGVLRGVRRMGDAFCVVVFAVVRGPGGLVVEDVLLQFVGLFCGLPLLLCG